MSSKLTDRDRGYKRRMQAIKKFEAGGGQLRVGITAAEGDKKSNDGKVTVLDKAIWNEFGTTDAMGKVRIPARSFLRAWFDINAAQVKLAFKTIMKTVAAGQRTKEEALNILGLKFVGQIQKRISAGVPPPNAESTVLKKGSSKPLIQDGQLRSSITHEVT